MLFREIDKTLYTTQVPRIHEPVRWLWVADYWDGPLEGVVEIARRRYWATTWDENQKGSRWFRRYLAIDLTDEKWAEEDYWRALFQRHVGTHCDYVEGKRPSDFAERVKPPSEHHHFYDAFAKRQPMNLSNDRVYGWFVD